MDVGLGVKHNVLFYLRLTSLNELGHENIIKFCGRPFKDLDQMDSIIINNWNSRVKDEDTVIHIGDFCFKVRNGKNSYYYINQLKGNKIFCRGNHDRGNGLNTHISKLYLHIGNKDICCVHKPSHADLSVPLNLVGHVHEKWAIKLVENSILVNVGVDQFNFRPVTYNEIERFISKARYSGLLELA